MKDLKQENNELRATVKQVKKELAFFINVGKLLTSTLEFNKVTEIIMGNVQKLVSVEAWSLLLIDDKMDEIYYAASKGSIIPGELKNVRLKIGEGIAGIAAERGKPLIVRNVLKDQRCSKCFRDIKGLVPRDILCVPIVSKKKTIGILELVNKKNGRVFTKNEQELMLKFADQASMAIEHANLYNKMSNLAITDDLTKLFNLRYLYRVLDTEVKRCRRYRSSFSIIFLDLDSFKLVNDTHGHLIGSKTLVEVARMLVSSLRDVDIISRYGGDEFVIVLPHTTVEMAYRIATRIHNDITRQSFLSEEGLSLRVTASFGVAGYPDHAADETELLKTADQAMYTAKGMGGNCVVVASDPALK
ncbi:MAG TPA: sensor domain-containing diguanylate cyclase [Nitrospirota bacterium]|nr:sensor domain-containing diguanylate cyclase [Nitrospirota bacterium]